MLIISALQLAKEVTAMDWSPVGCSLGVCSKSHFVYLWSNLGASVVQVPLPDFDAIHLQWSARGRSLILADDAAFCIAYMA